MMTKKKKGFTIVELVIVIAVIGILAAVLIPTFTGMVEEAKKSNDQQLVYHLNMKVKEVEVDRVATGKDAKAETMHDTLEAMNEKGFGVAKLTPTSNGDIIWDSTTNRFALVDANGTVLYYDETVAKPDTTNKKEDLWKVYKSVAEIDSKYSAYLSDSETTDPVSVTGVGFDAGDNKNLTSVTYTGAGKTVDIRTYSATTILNINNAGSDTVNHHGVVGKVLISEIDMNCYNEYGTAAYVKVDAGKVVVKAGGKISVVFANNTSGALVAVAKETTGTIERGLTIVEEVDTINYAGYGVHLEFSSGETPYTSQQIENIAKEAIEAAVDNELSSTAVWLNSYYNGKDKMSLVEFAQLVNDSEDGLAGYTATLQANVDLKDVEWTPITGFAGKFDGNNKTIRNLTIESNEESNLGLFATTENATIENLTLSNFKIHDTRESKKANSGALIGAAKNGLSLSHITVDSLTEVTGKKNGGLVGYISCNKACQFLFDSCSSSATVIGERCGGIVGQIDPKDSGYNDIFGFDIFTSCSFDGMLNANSGGDPMAGGIVAQYVRGNPQYLTHGFYNCSVNDSNISSSGTKNTKGSFVGFSQSGLSFFNCQLNGQDVVLPSALSSGRQSPQAFSINGVVYMIKTDDEKNDYININASYDDRYTCTVDADQQPDKYYFYNTDNGENEIVSGTKQVWYRVTNLFVDATGNPIFSSDDSKTYKGNMPTSLADGTKLQRRTYVTGYSYSTRQYTYGFDMWRIVSNGTQAEGTGLGQWQDVGTDGSTGFVLGAGRYTQDPTEFVNSNDFNISVNQGPTYEDNSWDVVAV